MKKWFKQFTNQHRLLKASLVLFALIFGLSSQAQNVRLLRVYAEGMGGATLGVSIDQNGKVFRVFCIDEGTNEWYHIKIENLHKSHPIVHAKIKGIIDKDVVNAVGVFHSNSDIEIQIGYLRNALTDKESDRVWFPIRVLYNTQLHKYEVWDVRKNEVVTEARAIINRAFFVKVGVDDFESE